MDKDTIGLVLYADNQVFKRSAFINLSYTDDFSMWTRILHPCFVCLLTTADTVMRHELAAQRNQPCPCGRLEMSYSNPWLCVQRSRYQHVDLPSYIRDPESKITLQCTRLETDCLGQTFGFFVAHLRKPTSAGTAGRWCLILRAHQAANLQCKCKDEGREKRRYFISEPGNTKDSGENTFSH